MQLSIEERENEHAVRRRQVDALAYWPLTTKGR
jgi:hypothetical protein